MKNSYVSTTYVHRIKVTLLSAYVVFVVSGLVADYAFDLGYRHQSHKVNSTSLDLRCVAYSEEQRDMERNAVADCHAVSITP